MRDLTKVNPEVVAPTLATANFHDVHKWPELIPREQFLDFQDCSDVTL